MLATYETFWQGRLRKNERKQESVSLVVFLVFGWMLDKNRQDYKERRKGRDDLKSLARTCKLNAHIVKKYRWKHDYYEINNEKRRIRRNRRKRNQNRNKKLQDKRHQAYDELITLIHDADHYKYNNRWSHYVKLDTIVGSWTVEQTLWTFGGGKGHSSHGRVRQKWKDRRRVTEHLHFFQYYRDQTGYDIHYHRSYDGARFEIYKYDSRKPTKEEYKAEDFVSNHIEWE